MYGVGSILAGKYRIERLIGEGGMGMVVAATHLHLGTQVALKFLHHDMAMNEQMTQRFLREARASALLKSEHVCRVSDVGTLDNGASYIVMELLAGHDLSSLLRQHGPMPINTASEYILQALVALAEAHAAGIVHRDLKPGNLFWTQRPDGTALIKVLDFGIAKAPGSVNFSLTQTSTVMGSPGYMSPEQLKSSKEVDARSDIWSMGVVLYELVTGHVPFAGDSITELALRVAMDPTPELPPGFPPTFQAIVARCLEKDPQRRYHDVADFAAALAPFGGPRGYELANGVTRVLRGHHAAPITQPSLGASTAPPSTQRPATSSVSTPTTLGAATGAVVTIPQRSNRVALIGGVLALSVVGVVIGVVLAMRSSGSTKRAASPPPPPAEFDAGVASAPVPPPPAPPDAAVATTPPPADAAVAATPPPADAAAPATTTTATTKTTTKPPRKRPPRKKKPIDVGDSRD